MSFADVVLYRELAKNLLVREALIEVAILEAKLIEARCDGETIQEQGS